MQSERVSQAIMNVHDAITGWLDSAVTVNADKRVDWDQIIASTGKDDSVTLTLGQVSAT